MLTIVLIVSAVLHGISLVLHAVQKRTNSAIVAQLAGDGDTASEAVDAIADKLEPAGGTAAAGAKTLLSLLALWLLGAALLASVTGLASCSPSQLETSINTTYEVTNAAAAVLEAASRTQEARIRAGAKTFEDGTAELAAWRAKVARVEGALDAVYVAIAVAKNLKDDHSVATMLAVLAVLKQEATALGVQL